MLWISLLRRRSGVAETFWLDSDSNGTPEPHTSNINWTYDELGRLTDEVFNHYDDLFDQTEHYTFDLTGNRLSKTTDLGAFVNGLPTGTIDRTITSTYDANDRLLTESQDTTGDTIADQLTEYAYDHTQQTGKTVFSSSVAAPAARVSSLTFAYDLQGRMSVATNTAFDGTSGAATRVERTTYDYDATGFRTSALTETDTNADSAYETRVLTEFLADHHSATGYTQTLRESTFDATTGLLTKTIDYSFGHDELTQTVTDYDTSGNATSSTTHVFNHDGHGSVRMLTDLAATIVQLFTYDAYGQLLAIHNGTAQLVSGGSGQLANGSTGQLANAVLALTSTLYSGETFDARTNQQYLRARWYNPANGRFNRLDPFSGNQTDPQSFHKYLYAHSDPIFYSDPTGNMSLAGMLAAIGSFTSSISFHVTLFALTYAPAIASVTTFAMFAMMFGMFWLLAEELNFVPDSNVPNWIVTVAYAVMTLGQSLMFVGNQMRSRMTPLQGTRSGGQIITGKEANRRVIEGSKRPGYVQEGKSYYANTPPHQPNHLAAEGQVSQDAKLVRVYTEKTPGVVPVSNRWVTTEAEIAGKSPLEIQQGLALEETPTHVVDVTGAGGQPARVSVANSINNQPGGGLQIEIWSKNYQQSNPRPLPLPPQ